MANADYHSEKWQPIPEFPGYEASSLGRIRNVNWRGCGPRVLKPAFDNGGYLHVRLYKDGGSYVKKVHRLVCEAFHGTPFPGAHAAHFDGTRDNNQPDNLRWATAKENIGDKVRHGTYGYGDGYWRSKLTSEIVREIRTSPETGSAIARRLGVNKTTVSVIRRGLAWKHVI